jgi:hypothetical protein
MLEELEEMGEYRLKTSCCHLQRMNCELARYPGGYGAINSTLITHHRITGWTLITERWQSNELRKYRVDCLLWNYLKP